MVYRISVAVFIALLIFALSACGSQRVAVTSTQKARVIDLHARGVQAIAVSAITDPPDSPSGVSGAGVGTLLTDAVQAQLSRLGLFEVNTRTELEAVQDAQQFNMSGWVSLESEPQSFQLTGTKILLLGKVHGFDMQQELKTTFNDVFQREQYYMAGSASIQATVKIIDVENGEIVAVIPLNQKINLRNPSWSSQDEKPAALSAQEVINRLCTAAAAETVQSIAPYKQEHFVALEEDAAAPSLAVGNSLAVSGRWSEAKVEFEDAVRSHPQSAAAHFNLGLALRTLGDGAAARQHFKRAYELEPKQKYLNELKR